jgi:tetratricopeptide (TPR) repeat protein
MTTTSPPRTKSADRYARSVSGWTSTIVTRLAASASRWPRTSAALGLILFVLLVRHVRGPQDAGVSFETIELAPPFALSGYTSSVVARRIIDDLNVARDSASTVVKRKVVGAPASAGSASLQIQFAGQSIPVVLLAQIRDWLTYEVHTPISGAVVLDTDSSAIFRIRVGTKSTSVLFKSRKGTIPDSAFRRVATFVLRVTEPYILASYWMKASPDAGSALLDTLSRNRDRRTRAEALTGLGYSRYDDQKDGKEFFYRRSIEADPSFTIPYLNVAGLYLQRNRYAEALAVLDSAPDDDASAFNRHWIRGMILYNLEDFSDAETEARLAIAIRDSPDAHSRNDGPILRLLASASAARHDFRSAEVAFRQAEMLDPNNEGIRVDHVLMLFYMSDSAGVNSELRWLTDHQTESKYWAPTLHALWHGADSVIAVVSALATLSLAQQADLLSIYGNSLSIYGRGHQSDGRQQEGGQLLRGAVSLDSADANALLRLAKHLCRTGVDSEAVIYIRRFLIADQTLHSESTLKSASSTVSCDRVERPRRHAWWTGR